MEKIQRRKTLWRLPLILAMIVVIVWGAWYLIAGEVPVIKTVNISNEWTLELPFSISRWFDAPLIATLVFVLIFIFTSPKITKNDDLTSNLTGGLLISLIVGMSTGFLGLNMSPTLGITTCLCYGTATFYAFGLNPTLISSLVTGLGFGLGLGLIVGMIIGMAFSLIVGLS